MIRTAILCSGQGAESAKMFDLLADAPAAAPVFQAASRLLGGVDRGNWPVGPTAPRFMKIGQVLCCAQAMAAWVVLGEVLPRPLLVLGYSVGELAAWGVAGLLDASGVLNLAVERAEALDAATSQPSGLAAIRGLSRAQLEPICRAHGAFIAIINGADQMLVGGTKTSLARVMEVPCSQAARTTMLAVAVASHTPLLARTPALRQWQRYPARAASASAPSRQVR